MDHVTFYPWFDATWHTYCAQSIAISTSGLFTGEEETVLQCGTYAECGPVTAAGRGAVFSPPRFARY
eukprot:1437932-Rhodomonas_salina.1